MKSQRETLYSQYNIFKSNIRYIKEEKDRFNNILIKEKTLASCYNNLTSQLKSLKTLLII